MTLNTSPETKIGKVTGWNDEEFINQSTQKTYTMLNKKGKEMGKMTKQELQQYFDEANVSISSNGIIYRTDKQGLIPALLEK